MAQGSNGLLWNEIHQFELARLVAMGLTASAIAERLKGIRPDITRNAVIGRCKRTGLQLHALPVDKRAPLRPPAERREHERIMKRSREAKRRDRARQAEQARLEAHRESVRSAEPLEPKRTVIPARPTGHGRCKFPMWNHHERANGHFCGEPSVPDKAYCQEHYDLCYMPVISRRNPGVHR